MICAVGMVKDEIDIIEPVLRHLVAEGVDRILLLDNLSTDGTSETLIRLEAVGLPLKMTDHQLRSMVLALWHEFGNVGTIQSPRKKLLVNE